jgi:hypothetical protein
MAGPSHDVDALRAKLKSLGYLDAGVDRFVLAPARAGRSFRQIAVRASVRLGVLAGLLLGPSGAVAARARVPGLLAGPRDTVVLAALLTLVFGAAVSLACLLAMLLAARIIRPSRRTPALGARVAPVARVAGALVGAISLGYLTFWWRATGGLATGPGWWLSAAAVAVAVAISVLLGQATSTTIEAMMASEAPGAAAPRRRLSLRASLAIALVGAAGSAAVLAVGTPAMPPEPATPALTVRPTGRRLLVVAVDGWDRSLARGLGKPGPGDPAGRAWLHPYCVLTPESPDPAREWVTIATGQPVERHGITALEARRLAGLEGQVPTAATQSRWSSTLAAAADLVSLTRPAINTGTVRREKTFWEVAAQAGLRTLALNWWTSWPAQPADGTVLSERAVLRLERGGPLAAEIVPAGLYESLRTSWPALAVRASSLAEHVVATQGGPQPIPAEIVRALREAALVDAQQLVLLDTLDTETVDLATVYLPGLDILASRLRELNRGDGATPALLVGAGEALTRYYAWLGGQLAVVVEPRRPAVEPILIVHPGRTGRFADLPPDVEQDDLELSPRCSMLDIAPSVLHLLGVPLSAELPGAPIARAAAGGEAGSHQPPVAVPTYGRRGVAPVRAQDRDALDEEMRERLRSLGYVR